MAQSIKFNDDIYIDSSGVTHNKTSLDKILTYSTTETKIGTWIDGRPLYRKVLTSPGLATATKKTILYNINNVKQMWIEKAFIEQTNQGRVVVLPEVGYNGELTSKTDVWIEKSDNCVYLYSNGGWGNEWVFYIILNYTKTTD